MVTARLINGGFYLLMLAAGLVTLAVAGEQKHKPVEVTVNPRIIMVGESTWLSCRVERHPDNRVLDYGIVGSEQEHSERGLEGDSSPITWPKVLIKHLPCDAGPAYCSVERADGSWIRAVQPIEIAGCEGH